MPVTSVTQHGSQSWNQRYEQVDECVTEFRPVTPPGRALSGWFALQVGGLQQQHRQRGPVRYRQSAQEQQLHHFRVHLGKQLGGRRVQGRTHWRQCAAWAIRCTIQDSGDVSTHPSLEAGLHVHVRGKHKPRVNWDNASTSARKRSARLCLALSRFTRGLCHTVWCYMPGEAAGEIRDWSLFSPGQILHTVWWYMPGEAAAEIWYWSLFPCGRFSRNWRAARFRAWRRPRPTWSRTWWTAWWSWRTWRLPTEGWGPATRLNLSIFPPPSPPPRPFQGVTCGCM